MKKMININFQGRIIPIEETSFDILKHYTESLRVYFAQEEGKDEIINDIESRIAELFSERLKNTACITDEDVNNVIGSMGRPEDFEEAESTGNYNVSGTPPDASRQQPPAPEPVRLWRRSLNEKILGGVCGGIANYLRIDPAIVRILFAIITVGSFGFWVLVYLLLWIILPGQVQTPNARKRFYRSKEHRVLGGVAGGLSAYFSTDIWVPRLIFAAPLLCNILSGILDVDGLTAFFGGLTGTFVIVYIILWIILPEARTASAKLEMKGEKVNLQSIKHTVQEDPGVIIQPRTGGLARAIGIIFKAFFLFIAGVISLAFITAFMALLFGGVVGGTGFYPFKDFIIENPGQEALLWSSLILFLAVPAIALLTWFIRRLMGIRSRRHYLGYVFGSLWIVGLICAIILTILVTKNYRVKENMEEAVPVYYPINGKLYVNVKTDTYSNIYRVRPKRGFPSILRGGDSLLLNSVRIDIAKSNDTLFHVHKLSWAAGADSKAATDRASRIHFPVTQSDSILLLPKGFTISSGDKFRNQQVQLVIEVPVGKKIVINDKYSFNWINIGINSSDWDDEWNEDGLRQYRWKSGVEYIMTEEGLRKTEQEENPEPRHKERRKASLTIELDSL